MIKGIPTNYGIDVLNGELKKEVQFYALIGKQTPKDSSLESILSKENITYDEVKDLVFHTKEIDVGYYDENGILTYEINLQNINSDNYMYGIALLDTSNNIIASLLTPQVVLLDGVGGLLTIKLPIKGEVNEVVFVSSDYVSRAEFEVLKASLKPPKVDIEALVEQITPLIQIKKDEEEFLNNKLDILINLARIKLLDLQNRKRDDDRIGEYKLFFRNSLPDGYRSLGSLLPIIKYPKAFLFFKNTNPLLQSDCPSGYFRLPRGNVYAKGANEIKEVGGFKLEGLPRPTKQTSFVSSVSAYNRDRGSGNGVVVHGINVYYANAVDNAIFGRSESVEVHHNLYLEGIYVGGGASF